MHVVEHFKPIALGIDARTVAGDLVARALHHAVRRRVAAVGPDDSAIATRPGASVTGSRRR
jgi:hypothetical protein